MNENETTRQIVKRPNLAAKRWIVMHRVAYGPFDSAGEADAWGEENLGELAGYVIQALHDPAKR